MPYAERTKVPVETTQGEMRKLLRKHGASDIALYDAEKESQVAFRLGKFWYRLSVPLGVSGKREAAQDERSAWRVLLLLVKAKLEAVQRGVTTVEHEFFADMMAEGGQTIYERAMPELQAAIADGRMPRPQLLLGQR